MAKTKMIVDSLRRGTKIEEIKAHYGVGEKEILEAAAIASRAVHIPSHLVEYIKLQEMEKIWETQACKTAILPPDAYRMLLEQRMHFHLTMEVEIRRVMDLRNHPDIQGPVDAFRGITEAKIKPKRESGYTPFFKTHRFL